LEGRERACAAAPDQIASQRSSGIGNNNASWPPMGFLSAVNHLFFTSQKFRSHRLVGLCFLIQYAAAVYLYLADYDRYLDSPFVWSLPLTGLTQSIIAAFTFTFLPRKEDPGFAAISDKSVLSYYTVVENSFYAMQLVFVSVYLHQGYRESIIRRLGGPLSMLCGRSVVEYFFVFFIFYVRTLWPVSKMGAGLKNSAKNKSEKNMVILTASTYAVKIFYLFAKHFLGFFVNYLIFLGRVEHRGRDQRLLYGVQLLSGYAATVSIFIHTLKFKGYIGPLTAMVAYDIIIPGFAYLFWNAGHLFAENPQLAIVCLVALFVNLLPKPAWHCYQLLVAVALSAGWVAAGGGSSTVTSVSTVPSLGTAMAAGGICAADGTM